MTHVAVIDAGPTSFLVMIDADESSRLIYKTEVGPRKIALGAEFANLRFALIDTMRAIYVIDPTTARLVAMVVFSGSGYSVVYTGAMWGQVTTEAGQRIRVPDPVDHLRRSRVPMEFGAEGDIRFEFNINHHMRVCFTTDCQSAFRRGSEQHNIGMKFAIPSGTFLFAQVLFTSRDGGGGSGGGSFGVRGFPLVFPYLAPRSFDSAPPAGKEIDDSSAVFGPGIELGWGDEDSQGGYAPPPPPVADTKRKLSLRGSSRPPQSPSPAPPAPVAPPVAAKPRTDASPEKKPLKLRGRGGAESSPPAAQPAPAPLAPRTQPPAPDPVQAPPENDPARPRKTLNLRKQ